MIDIANGKTVYCYNFSGLEQREVNESPSLLSSLRSERTSVSQN